MERVSATASRRLLAPAAGLPSTVQGPQVLAYFRGDVSPDLSWPACRCALTLAPAAGLPATLVRPQVLLHH